MKNILMIAVILVSITSCKTQQPFQLSFGSGGGFTGQYTTYTLANDGKVYKEQSATKTKEQVTAVSKKQLKEIEALVTKVNFPALFVNNPGNMSYFVNLTKEGKTYNSQWSGKTSGNAALDDLSMKLNALIINK